MCRESLGLQKDYLVKIVYEWKPFWKKNNLFGLFLRLLMNDLHENWIYSFDIRGHLFNTYGTFSEIHQHFFPPDTHIYMYVYVSGSNKC